jgi:hypothetical protein
MINTGDRLLDHVAQQPESRFVRYLRFGLIFVVFSLLQAPFLRADADPELSIGRGTYTDEGLYSAQVRNSLVTGHLDLSESDGVIKEPIFAAINWLVARFWKDDMAAARTSLMLACTLMLALFASGSGRFSRSIWIAFPVVFLSYYPFHYAHLDMAEFPACLFTLLAVAATWARLRGASRAYLACAAAAAAISYALKIQFLYVAAIPPGGVLLAIGLRRLSRLPVPRQYWLDFAVAIALALAFAALYALVWIVPHADLYFRIMGAQVALRTEAQGSRLRLGLHNVHLIVADHHAWPLILIFLLGLAVLAGRWRATADNSSERSEWIAAVAPLTAWIILESHKLFLGYLPSRYLLGSFLAASLLGTAGLALASQPGLPSSPRIWRVAVLGVGLVAFILNAISFGRSLDERRYVLAQTQSEFQSTGNWRGKKVLGPWAPALFWGSGAIVRPVWNGYFNDHDILATERPAAIVSEPDQQDSEGALANDGVHLPASPIKSVTVGPWTVNVYSMSAP